MKCKPTKNHNQIQKDFETLTLWLNRIINNLKEKLPSFHKHIAQASALRPLFAQIRTHFQSPIPENQAQHLVHFLELTLWLLHLSVCATLAEKTTKNPNHAQKFVKISNQLFTNFELQKNHLAQILISRLENFDINYGNTLIYSIIENFVSFYKHCCSIFKNELKIEKNLKFKNLKCWERVCFFLGKLRDKTEHEYDITSTEEVDLKDFDSALELDSSISTEYHSKIGSKVHKYPLSILILLRFLLKEEGTSFEAFNRDWFSCNQKAYDHTGKIVGF